MKASLNALNDGSVASRKQLIYYQAVTQAQGKSKLLLLTQNTVSNFG